MAARTLHQRGECGRALRCLAVWISMLLTGLAWQPLPPVQAMTAKTAVSVVNPVATAKPIEIGCHHHGGEGHANQGPCVQLAALPVTVQVPFEVHSHAAWKAPARVKLTGLHLTPRIPPPKSPIML